MGANVGVHARSQVVQIRLDSRCALFFGLALRHMVLHGAAHDCSGDPMVFRSNRRTDKRASRVILRVSDLSTQRKCRDGGCKYDGFGHSILQI